jgi:hypothetical protein
VIVHGDGDLVLVGIDRNPLCDADRRRGGDHLHPKRLGHLEATLDLLVGEAVVETVVVGLELHAGRVKLLLHRGEGIERRRQPPLADLITVPRVRCRPAIRSRRPHLRPRLDVAGEELTLADPDLRHRLQRVIKRHRPETVGLNSNPHPLNADLISGSEIIESGTPASMIFPKSLLVYIVVFSFQIRL